MSRNLCSTRCDHCDETPRLEEAPRPITRADAGCYFTEYEGMLVANAICPLCEAKYLAWVDERPRLKQYEVRGIHIEPRYARGDDPSFVDLSYRAAFNDEPADEDLPVYEVRPARVGPYVKGASGRW